MQHSPVTQPSFRLVRTSPPPQTPPRLDEAQQRVRDHDRGVLLVLAGPGTGKTTTLVEAVVDRVQRRGEALSSMLLLTYSRSAAADLRRRVTARLSGTVSEPPARTFHSYAFGLLRQAAVLRGDPPPRLLSSSEQDVTLREMLEGRLQDGRARWPAELSAAVRTRAFVDELADLLMRAVERDIDPETLRTVGMLRGRPDWVEAAGVLGEYLEVTSLQAPGAFDAPELIRRAIAELRHNPSLLAAERSKRRRVFVDEYQDADPAQVALLRVLSEGADELVVIGDPDQSIYGFRGADPEALNRVEADFAGVSGGFDAVSLTVSRRSGATLLAASRRVAARLPGPGRHRALVAASGLAAGEVTVSHFSSTSQEAAHIARVLRRAHFGDGVAWSQMAVLTRSAGTTLDSLRRGLAAAGVPVDRSARGALIEEPIVMSLVTLLRCVAAPADLTAEAATDLLTAIGRADPLQLTRIDRYLRRFPGGPVTTADLLREPAVVAFLPESLRGPVDRVRAVIEAGVAEHASTQVAEDVLWQLWQATGLASRLERRSLAGGIDGARADRDLDAVVLLFAEAAKVSDRSPGGGVRQLYDWVEQLQISDAPVVPDTARQECVAVVTAHASKGLEWDVVCVAGVQEGTWPSLRQRGSLLGSDLLVDVLEQRPAVSSGQLAQRVHEERRLFYVAVTRARRRLHVSAVDTEDERPSRFLDELDPQEAERPILPVRHRFVLSGMVAELRAALGDPELGDEDRRSAISELARLARAGVAGADPSQWWGVADLSTDAPIRPPADGPVPIRPSRFETYLDCELKALLSELGAVDASDQVAAALGTLVHEVAELAPDAASVDDLQRLLDERWARLEFSAPWQRDGERERATLMLTKLADWLTASRSELSLVGRETPFSVVIGDVELGGMVDRIERDDQGRLVVIDFKTGKSKPTKEKVLDHAQLAAYQLAIAEGGFAEVANSAAVPGGARLVQLGAGAGAVEQSQPPLDETGTGAWVRTELERVAEVLRSTSLTARVGPACANCRVKTSCPAQNEGRAVTR